MKELLIDWTSYNTLQDEEICCPNYGSWTNIEDLEAGEFVANCLLCKEVENA